VGCLPQCQDGMTIIEVIQVKLEWYLEVLTGSVAMQVSMKSYQLLEQIDEKSTKIVTVNIIGSNLAIVTVL